MDITNQPCSAYAELFLISPQGRVQIENGAISIAALNLSDSGMYQCVAENKHGIIYSSAQLMVLGEIACLPLLFFLLICVCLIISKDKKTKKPDIAHLSSQCADSFHVTVDSASRNMNQIESLILLLLISLY